MTKLSHQLQGVVFSACLFLFTHNPLYSLLFYMGNLTPDVDVLWNDLSTYRNRWYSHRGVTHSLLIPLSLLLLSGFLLAGEKLNLLPIAVIYSGELIEVELRASSCLLSFSLGYLNHLLFDSMSPSGIPKKLSYYPRFKLWTLYRTGDIREFLLLLTSLFIAVFLTVLLNSSYIKLLFQVLQ